MTAASRQRTPAQEVAKQQSTGMPPLRGRSAWALLEKHYQKIKDVHLRQLFADDSERGTRLAVEAAGVYLDYSKNRITDETLRLLLAARSRVRAERPYRGDVPRRQDQRLREPRGAARSAAGAARRVHHSRWAQCRARRPCGAGPDGGLCREGAQRGMERPYRQAHPQCDQYRHRRLRSRAGHGLRSAATLQRPRA